MKDKLCTFHHEPVWIVLMLILKKNKNKKVKQRQLAIDMLRHSLLYPMQCKDNNAIEDMYSFLYAASRKLNGTVTEALLIIGGGCPDKTDTLSTMGQFEHALEVFHTQCSFLIIII